MTIVSLAVSCAGDPLTEATYIETLYVWDGGGWNQITTNGGAGGGDVSAAANLGDHTIIRGDGGLKGVQDSTASISDAGVLTVVGDITNVAAGGDINSGNNLNCVNDLGVTDDANVGGDLDVTGAITVGGTVDTVDIQDHSTRHESGGADAIKLDDLATPDDNTDLDFSITRHGLVPKGTNVGNFLKDDGTWAATGGGLAMKAGQETTDGSGDATVSFNSNFSDTNYAIQLTAQDTGDTMICMWNNKAVGGFDIHTENDQGNDEANVVVDWFCIEFNNP